jgi:hypothetical protein
MNAPLGIAVTDLEAYPPAALLQAAAVCEGFASQLSACETPEAVVGIFLAFAEGFEGAADGRGSGTLVFDLVGVDLRVLRAVAEDLYDNAAVLRREHVDHGPELLQLVAEPFRQEIVRRVASEPSN